MSEAVRDSLLPGRFAIVTAVTDRHGGEDTDLERGLRGLIGPGSPQVSLSAAKRARDAARVPDQDIARAETELEIIRRGWQPRDPLR